jgi:thiol:disulfide interchange protein DsbC
VAREFALGREVGVSGTPAIYTAAGVHIGGYLEPQRMLQALDALQAQNAAP